MRFAVLAVLLSVASAFTAPTMTFAVGKKKPAAKATKVVKPATRKVVAKKAPAKKPVARKPAPKPTRKVVAKAAPKPVAKKAPARKAAPKKAAPKPKKVGVIPSAAIPNEDCPALLDGRMVGDVGFDPCFLSTKADQMVPYFNGIMDGKGPTDGLTWYREAELMHGRIAMVATVGFLWPGLFGTFPGNEWTGLDAFSYTNPMEALGSAPSASLFQIFSFMGILEFRRIRIIQSEGNSYMAGDSQKWGQGPGRWNPFGLNYSPAEYREKQLQEIKHARLAMIGLLGLIFQANISGVSVADQLGAAFVTPDYYAKAGYFLPEGI